MNLPSRTVTSPALSGSSTLPYFNTPSISEFEIERFPTQSGAASRRVVSRRDDPIVDEEYVFRDSVSRVLAARTRPFTVSGRIPFDPSTLVLFFHSKSGLSHSLNFPIDVEINAPPALDVLISACIPNPTVLYDEFSARESLLYPPSLPITATLEISNHPIMDAVRNTLFPLLPNGHYLTAIRDRLDVLVSGSLTSRQLPSMRNDSRVATIYITLPVRFRGGTLVIRDGDGSEERYFGRGGKGGEMEWTAFLADCEYEVETVQKGCKLSISYGVYLRTFGAGADPLITPSENFMDLFPPILDMTRGRKLAFFLLNDYDVNPSEALAESLVPSLKGGDSLLYHSLKAYKLDLELHWTAGGYIWPVDRTVECVNDTVGLNTYKPFSSVHGTAPKGVPGVHGPFGISYGPDAQAEEAEKMRLRIEGSGAIPISEADILILTDWESPGPVGRERVPFVSGGVLEKLVVNVLLVTYIL